MGTLMHHSFRLQKLGSDMSGVHSQAALILNNGDGTKCFPSNGSGHTPLGIATLEIISTDEFRVSVRQGIFCSEIFPFL
uniref:Uncharacterized protein n=1 Tax=Arundo donax TaxID=35708 RepID=A0A0A8ZJP0_ARUDO